MSRNGDIVERSRVDLEVRKDGKTAERRGFLYEVMRGEHGVLTTFVDEKTRKSWVIVRELAPYAGIRDARCAASKYQRRQAKRGTPWERGVDVLKVAVSSLPPVLLGVHPGWRRAQGVHLATVAALSGFFDGRVNVPDGIEGEAILRHLEARADTVTRYHDRGTGFDIRSPEQREGASTPTAPDVEKRRNAAADVTVGPSVEGEGPHVFTFHGTDVRIFWSGNTFEAVAKDICEAIGRRGYRTVLAKLPEEYKGVRNVDTPGGSQQMTTLREPGVYWVIARSNRPTAKPFQSWLFEEVLPTLRALGSYSLPDGVAFGPQPPSVSNALAELGLGSESEDFLIATLVQMRRAALENKAAIRHLEVQHERLEARLDGVIKELADIRLRQEMGRQESLRWRRLTHALLWNESRFSGMSSDEIIRTCNSLMRYSIGYFQRLFELAHGRRAEPDDGIPHQLHLEVSEEIRRLHSVDLHVRRKNRYNSTGDKPRYVDMALEMNMLPVWYQTLSKMVMEVWCVGKETH